MCVLTCLFLAHQEFSISPNEMVVCVCVCVKLEWKVCVCQIGSCLDRELSS